MLALLGSGASLTALQSPSIATPVKPEELFVHSFVIGYPSIPSFMILRYFLRAYCVPGTAGSASTLTAGLMPTPVPPGHGHSKQLFLSLLTPALLYAKPPASSWPFSLCLRLCMKVVLIREKRRTPRLQTVKRRHQRCKFSKVQT